jgi:protein-S-isoprenylcysteine O-methyltransferase Ste14
MPASRLKIPPVVTGLLLGGLMWAAARTAPDFGFMLPARRIGALLLALTGVGIALLGVISFRRARTTVNPLHPEAASTLVVSGVYRFTRNPMYLGLLLVLLGWAVFLANALAFVFPAIYVPLMNRLQILPEERALAEKFGAGFADYKSQVRRWL